MNGHQLSQLFSRHKIIIPLTTIVCAAVGLYVGLHLNSIYRFDNSIFIDFSIQDKNHQTSSYENLEAADQITESIQGWIKDTSFQNTINSTTHLNFGIQAKKQEKNNLIINFNTTTADQASVIGNAINKELEARLRQYNNNADLNIFANAQPLQINPKTDLTIIYAALGAITGFLLSLLFAWTGEKLFSKKS